MAPKVVLDANILYSARLRDLLMELAVSGVIDIVWTKRIDEEWIAAILRDHPGLSRQLRRTASEMRRALPDARVEVDDADTPDVVLPDSKDRHVVAAVVASGASAIITFNTKDFPKTAVGPLGIEVLSPDEQLLRLAKQDPEAFLAATATVRARLKAPAVSASRYAVGLARAGCPGVAAWLKTRLEFF